MLDRKTENQPLSEADKLAWLRLFRTENVGPITFYRLVERFGAPEKALEVLPELSRRGGRTKPLKAPDLSTIEKEYESLREMGGDIVTAACPAYPLALGATDDAPPVLSYFGDITLANKNCIAIVGARNASLNGRKFATKLAGDLGARDQVVVSGLARGIDTAAHKGSLSTGTIAVVAGGIDVIYPQENTALFEEIKECGLILAESPLGTQPIARHFPKRNRIVSGLSRACVVIEATMRSGSLITARMAGEQGRDVMAVPGHPLDPRAQGPNHLIREGATLVRNADDILEIIRSFSGNALREPFHPLPSFTQPAANDEDMPEDITEKSRDRVLENLSFTPVTVDELLRSCHMTIPVLQTVLLELELAGRIKREPGGRVSLLD
ncbi:MAG: DNA-processing protein DprA [Alphaproteobacteria bacterium]|nr:DNA-processing protein DprA [Alphaproteobacteria bacterium]